MSRFFSEKYRDLTPYTPGEQPRDQAYIKLNTNESPFAPPASVAAAAAREAARLQLYPDPECTELRAALADQLGIRPQELILTNGSDEVLNFAFMAFCDEARPALFPDITYGFYPVFARLSRVPYQEIPLREDWSIRLEDYADKRGTIFLANPNAPTGIALDRDQVEWLLRKRPDDLLVVDEAYVDFGAESSVPLIGKYDNLLVCQTFSKSWSMAGARLGFGVGNEALIRDLNTVKYSTNPYTVNRMTAAAGLASVREEEARKRNCRTIMENRQWTASQLKELGFEMTNSAANFLFVRHPRLAGETLYLELKKRGILIRHFSPAPIREYNRITVGTREQMDALVKAVREILEDAAKEDIRT